jgi:hypothetical protein
MIKVTALLLLTALVLFCQVSPPLVVLPGAPPGGVGAACTAPALFYANLTTGVMASCVSSVWTALAGGGGSGTVNAGTASHLSYYASSTNAVSDMGADLTWDGVHTLTGGSAAILDLTLGTAKFSSTKTSVGFVTGTGTTGTGNFVFSISPTTTGTSVISGCSMVGGIQSCTATKFTISGCSAGSTLGGATAGSFASGTTGTCTVVITLNGATGITAPNGWSCDVHNLTNPINLPGQTATSTTTATVSGTTTSGDVLQFKCVGY